MKLVIAGSRTVEPTPEDIGKAVEGVVIDYGPITEVISGHAFGADRAGEEWARQNDIPVHLDPVTKEDIERHGKYLGPKMRNRRMAERGDIAIVFWDGQSGGAADMCCRMVARRKIAIVVPTKKAPRQPSARQRGERRTVDKPDGLDGKTDP